MWRSQEEVEKCVHVIFLRRRSGARREEKAVKLNCLYGLHRSLSFLLEPQTVVIIPTARDWATNKYRWITSLSSSLSAANVLIDSRTWNVCSDNRLCNCRMEFRVANLIWLWTGREVSTHSHETHAAGFDNRHGHHTSMRAASDTFLSLSACAAIVLIFIVFRIFMTLIVFCFIFKPQESKSGPVLALVQPSS